MSSVPLHSDATQPSTPPSGHQGALSRWSFARASALLARMPLRFGYALANGFAWPHYLLFPERRRAVASNLSVMLPAATAAQRRRATRGVMAAYKRMLFEFFRLPRLTREALLANVELDGFEHITRALERGRGVILSSSHIGNWELGAVVIALHGHRLHAVAGVQLGRWFSGAVRDAKSDLAVLTVAPADSYRKLFRALGHNDIVALMVDGNIFSHGTPVPFFGREANWPAGPGVLAKRTGAPVVCGYCERLAPGRFRIVLEPPLEPEEFPTPEELNRAIAATTERHIAGHVEQWCIFRPFWQSPEPTNATANGEGA
jgi:lauroyl/myristoyl acyltransferase